MNFKSSILISALLLSAIFFHNKSFTQEGTIKLIFAKTVSDYKGIANTTKANGDVHFEHNATHLFCDSAIFFQNKNLIFAYGNVQINQGDTVNLFCDSLIYNGTTNISQLRGHVRFRDSEYKLTTDSLDYDGKKSYGYYKNWATITSINQDLKLTAKKGYYYSGSKTFFFKDSVHVEHPEYEVFSDTLEFRTISSSAHFHGPTVIYLDSSQVNCNRGVYYTQEQFIRLWNGATLYENHRTLFADSLVFDQVTDIGEGFCHVRLYDSTENVLFLSDYLFKAPNNEKITLHDNAHIVQFKEKDTLFISADTIYHKQDSLTDMQQAIAIKNVEIINAGISVACDSAYFSEKDSILKLHKMPAMWAQGVQLTADSILAEYYNDEFHRLFLYDKAFAVTEKDSAHYDQLKGKYMIAYLDSSKIKNVYIESNAQTLYFLTEDVTDSLGAVTKPISGMNQLDCNAIMVYFLNSEIQNVAFRDQPTGTYRPIYEVPERDQFLKGYLWVIDRKPSPILLE